MESVQFTLEHHNDRYSWLKSSTTFDVRHHVSWRIWQNVVSVALVIHRL